MLHNILGDVKSSYFMSQLIMISTSYLSGFVESFNQNYYLLSLMIESFLTYIHQVLLLCKRKLFHCLCLEIIKNISFHVSLCFFSLIVEKLTHRSQKCYFMFRQFFLNDGTLNNKLLLLEICY